MPLHWWGHFIVDLGRQVMHQPGSLLMRRAAFANHQKHACWYGCCQLSRAALTQCGEAGAAVMHSVVVP